MARASIQSTRRAAVVVTVAACAAAWLGSAPVARGATAAGGGQQLSGAAASAPHAKSLKEDAADVSCFSSHVCLVAGQVPKNSGDPEPVADIAEIVNGTPKHYRQASGVMGFDAISCPSPRSSCLAIGVRPGADIAAIISRSGRFVTETALNFLPTAVSCFHSTSACEAALYTGNEVQLVSIKGQTAGPGSFVRAPVGSGALSISCASATFCEIVGSYTHVNATTSKNTTNGFVMPVVKGKPGKLTTVVKGFGLTAVSCPKHGHCIVAGDSPSGRSLVGTLHGTKLTGVHHITGAASLDSLSCSSATHCIAVGSNQHSTEGVVVTVSRGKPGAPLAIKGSANLTSVSAGPGSFYEAVGVKRFGPNVGKDVVVSGH
jgi:hypothetical protein